MAQAQSSDFTRAFGDAKKQARAVAGDAADAAQDLYDNAAELAGNANAAARKTAGSFERALRNTIENQPYTAVVVALGIGWFLGRMHRPM
jgi:ElaB/YqjD/DUF883 family membrane-anchored ribosome-binding protein